MRFVIDAGHGGSDPGAVGNGLREADLNLTIALALGKLLIGAGHTVTQARMSSRNLDPMARNAIIAAKKPDGFISIHCNAAIDPNAHGAETIYREGTPGASLADFIQAAMCEKGDLRNRGTKRDADTPHKRLAVLGVLTVPSVLVEVGFISNAADVLVIQNIDEMARRIMAGIVMWARARGMK